MQNFWECFRPCQVIRPGNKCLHHHVSPLLGCQSVCCCVLEFWLLAQALFRNNENQCLTPGRLSGHLHNLSRPQNELSAHRRSAGKLTIISMAKEEMSYVSGGSMLLPYKSGQWVHLQVYSWKPGTSINIPLQTPGAPCRIGTIESNPLRGCCSDNAQKRVLLKPIPY